MRMLALVSMFFCVQVCAMVNDPLFKQPPWYQGGLAQALVQAKKEKRPVFVYWGAVWCPPCNELKNEVFSKDRFKDLMQDSLNVFLDGDSESAQSWGDTYKISGYPTLLVLSPNGKERLRLNTSVDFQEFQEIITLTRRGQESAKEIFERALKGTPSAQDWQLLSQLYWQGIENSYADKLDLMQKRLALLNKIPSDSLQAETGLLTASFLQFLLEQDTPERKVFFKNRGVEIRKWSETLLTHEKSVFAARGFIAYSMSDALDLLFPEAGDKAGKEALAKKWAAANAALASNKACSIDVRLWATVSSALYEKSPESKAIVLQAVHTADQEAKNPYERHAVISGAAYALREIGEWDAARKLLRKELATTDTPWYYQSAFANLEVAAGNIEEGFKWSKAAKQSVQGRASKIQWTTDNLLFVMKHKISRQDEELASVLAEYYELAFGFSDGFKGRNAVRAKKISDQLKNWNKQKVVAEVIKKYQRQCSAKKVEGCLEHFQLLLPQA